MGIGGGYGCQLLSQIAHFNHRRYIGFDTFAGFPDGTNEDGSFDPKRKLIYQNFTQAYIYEQLKLSGVPRDAIANITFIEGLLPHSLKSYKDDPGFIYMDLDLYEPHISTLKLIYPRLRDKGIILFDDYDEGTALQKWPGCKAAIDEFCESEGLPIQRHWTGRAYIQKK